MFPPYSTFRLLRQRLLLACCLVIGVLVSGNGCGPQPVVGGTKGSLTGGNAPVSELQLTVHAQENGVWKPIGFAISTTDGTFELVTPGAQGPLELSPGEYRCTLESAGVPLVIPKPYLRPETTPLVVNWPTSSQRLDLSFPTFRAVR